MTLDRIDWSRLQTFANDKRRSFEELCYQIVEVETRGNGRLTRLEGAGGDGGVEFYLKRNNGAVWGWQAKFFWPNERLDGGRKEQVKTSLAKACRTHPRLERWTLMMPGNLTQDEDDWFQNQLPTSIHKGESVVPAGVNPTLIHQGASELLIALRNPLCSGIIHFFFGATELSEEWFRRSFVKSRAIIGKKFISTLHSQTTIDHGIAMTIGGPLFIDVLSMQVTALQRCVEDTHRTRLHLASLVANTESAKILIDDFTLRLQTASAHFERIQSGLQTALESLRDGDWKRARDLNFDSAAESACNSVIDLVPKITFPDFSWNGARDEDAKELARSAIVDFVAATNDCLNTIIGTKHLLAYSKQSECHILGAAGQGKTHAAAHLVLSRLDSGLPAILLVGVQFTTEEPIETQIKRLLDVEELSWADLLCSLDACARAYRTRIPIVIDGLNEATRSGALSPIWSSHLKAFCANIQAQTDAVVVITTCRTSYRTAIWETDGPDGAVELNVENSYDVRDALHKYFQHYKIVADPSPAAFEQFRHPIYLRLFCEATNPEHLEPKHVVLGEETLFNVFDRYLDQCNGRVIKAIGRPTGSRLVAPAMQTLAEALWNDARRALSVETAYQLVDGDRRETIKQSESVMTALQNEDLLVYRDWGTGEEVVAFTYDLLGGYAIARHLIAAATGDPAAYFGDATVRERLFGDLRSRHPLADDISRCLAALSPRTLSKRIDLLVDHPGARAAAISAMFEVSAQWISEDDVAIVRQLFKQPDKRRRLLDLAPGTLAHPDHPLNASLWTVLLNTLSIADRDLTWSEHIRVNSSAYRSRLADFEFATRRALCDGVSDTMRRRFELLGEHAMWLLTSTVRPLRDEATRALYCFGRLEPQLFLELVQRGMSVNDPYVRERLVAALYGVCMARAWEPSGGSFHESTLPAVARFLYSAFFSSAPTHGTTHCLTRDFASHTIELALKRSPSCLSDVERARCVPPFADGGVREWGTSEDRDAGSYREGNAPLGMDFKNYTLGRLVKDRGNYDFKHAEYLTVVSQVMWRLYDLGYSLEAFGSVDQWIASTQSDGRGEDASKTDRYGKKYALIAFFELLGLRSDAGLLKDRYEQVRTPTVDIDPSFPVKCSSVCDLEIPNLLGSASASAKAWVTTESAANFSDLVQRNELDGLRGPWVLLDGYISQQDSTKSAHCWFHSFVVDADHGSTLEAAVRGGQLTGTIRAYTGSSDHYLFAGEVPWAGSYPETQPDPIEVPAGAHEEERSREELTLYRDGVIVSGAERYDAFMKMKELATETDEGEDGLQGTLQAFLETERLELRSETVRESISVVDSVSVPALDSVRHNSWESYHTVTSPGRSFSTPAKQIAAELGLHARPDEWELFDDSGRQVTRNVVDGDTWTNGAHLTYMRSEQLETYLRNNSKVLVIIGDGERLLRRNAKERLIAADGDEVKPADGDFSDVWVIRPTEP